MILQLFASLLPLILSLLNYIAIIHKMKWKVEMAKIITNKGNKGAYDHFHIEWLNEIWTSPTSFILTYQSILYWTISINLSTRPIKIGLIFVYKGALLAKLKGCNLKNNFCSSFTLLLHIKFFKNVIVNFSGRTLASSVKA